jgi:hypothetical protein
LPTTVPTDIEAVDGRMHGPADVARRLRLATPAMALFLGLVTLLLEVVDIPIEDRIGTLSVGNYGFQLVFVVPFALVGVVVARREPRNPMGWLLIGVPLLQVLASVAADYTVFVYHFGHRAWPLGSLAVLLDFSFPSGLLLMPLVLLMFPDGRLSTRWKWVVRATYVAYAVFLAGQLSVAAVALQRRVPVWGGGGIIGARNPSGFAAWFGVAEVIITPLFGLLCLAAIARQLISYRTSTGVRRQQLKWLGAGGAWCILALLALVSGVANSAPGFVWLFIVFGWTALPVSIGVGILRYRLYDIDRLISRTLSYAILTALLVGMFIGLIALTTNTLAISGRVGVAASTLSAAALFNPLRKRIQHLVDRRFNRTRYNADATVAAFTAKLRDAVEIDAIRADLLATVRHAVQPTHATVWIKPPAHR